MEDELCEVCEDKVTFCSCQRCVLCATIFEENDDAMDDDGYCADCQLEEVK